MLQNISKGKIHRTRTSFHLRSPSGWRKHCTVEKQIVFGSWTNSMQYHVYIMWTEVRILSDNRRENMNCNLCRRVFLSRKITHDLVVWWICMICVGVLEWNACIYIYVYVINYQYLFYKRCVNLFNYRSRGTLCIC